MAQATEAACLLHSGSTYSRRFGLRTGSGDDVFFGIRQGGFSLYFDDAPIYHFDFEGRWQRAFVDGTHYLRGLDATVRSISRGREGGGMILRRRIIPSSGAAVLDETIRSAALRLIDGVAAGDAEVIPPPSEALGIGPREFREYLERVTTWDASAWQDHRSRYLATYRRWPLLPPDSPNPVVLEATSGHSSGRSFGGARAPDLHIRSPQDLEAHARAVVQLLGRRLCQSRDVFLAGAEVLHQPSDRILAYMDVVRSRFSNLLHPNGDPGERESDTPRPGVVQAFLDDFRSPLPDLGDWQRLRGAQLGRVTLGIESGAESIRSTFGKSWDDAALRKIVADLKVAGIGVGVIVLVGVGGRERAEAHVQATASLIDSLGLGAGDLISIIDVRSLDDETEAVDLLSDDEVAGQFAALKRRLNVPRSSKGLRVVAYNPAKQWT